MKIQLVRNATMKIHYNGKIILTDPVLSAKHCMEPFDGKERNPIVDLPFDANAVIADVDMVLVSHHHKDHFDEKSEKWIPKNIPIFCQPGDEERFEKNKFMFVTPIQDKIVWDDISIYRTSGQHGTGTIAIELGSVSGFVLIGENEPRVYWTGDTIFCDEVKNAIAEHSPDIIITHSGGAMIDDSGPIIMDANQTIEICKIAPNSTVVAVHLEAFDLTTVRRSDLRNIANTNMVTREQLRIPFDGEVLKFK